LNYFYKNLAAFDFGFCYTTAGFGG